MFQKPFKVKSHTLVKKSERKKLHDQLLQRNVSKEVLEDLLPLKGDLGVTRLITHSNGEVQVYNNKKTPYFFTFQHLLIPTVYALWKHPGFVANFTTHEFVFSRLQNGADLMLPGVMVPKSGLVSFKVNEACSINISSNMAAVAVGVTEMDELRIRQNGVKSGKLVTVLHCYGDLLWKMGESVNLPLIPGGVLDEDVSETDGGDDNDDDLVGGMVSEMTESLNIDGKSASACNVGNDGGGGDDRDDDRKSRDHVDEKDGEAKDKDDEVELYKHPSIPDNMDDLLRTCFLYALKRHAKQMKLPLLTNLFYKNYMMPCCPKDHPLQVKKSSHKKLSTLLAGLRDEGFIGIEQLSTGVESISSVDLDHPSSFEIPAWELNSVPRDGDEEDNNDDEPWHNYTPPEFSLVYIATAPILPILNHAGKRFAKGDVVTCTEVKDIMTSYVKVNNLQEGRFVKLDILLSHTLLRKDDYTEVLVWADLLEALKGKMTKAHLVQCPGKPALLQKGNIANIKFDVKKKASNKKVTEVWNLALYGINLPKLASYVQRSVSCNAFVDKSAVLFAAGNQINFIQKILIEKYGIASKYMVGLEKAEKKKKTNK